jgi:hypothetical protein
MKINKLLKYITESIILHIFYQHNHKLIILVIIDCIPYLLSFHK